MISNAVLVSELCGVRNIVEKWLSQLENGLPGKDIPAAEDAVEHFVLEMTGELLVAAGKLENLASIMSRGD